MPGNKLHLSEIPFLEGLSESELMDIASLSQGKVLHAGEQLYKCGEVPGFVSFIAQGRMLVQEISPDGRVVGIKILKRGDSIGWLSLVDGLPLTSNVTALDTSRLLLIPLLAAQRFMLSNPLMTERLLKLLVSSIRRSRAEKHMLSLPNAFHRIFVQINQLSSDAPTGRTLEHLPKQQELASIVNTSRETVSRALQLLIKKGIIGKTGHQIVIKELDMLKKLAADGLDALPDKR